MPIKRDYHIGTSVIARRADKNPYPHDGRADKGRYRHDSRADKNPYRHNRRADSLSRVCLLPEKYQTSGSLPGGGTRGQNIAPLVLCLYESFS